MSYELAIHPLAERERGRLDGAVRKRFKQKLLTERLLVPRVAKDALHGLAALTRSRPCRRNIDSRTTSMTRRWC